MPTRRQEKINARLVVEISHIIRELKDPRIGFVTITAAQVTADLSEAKILFSVYGDSQEIDNSTAALQHAARYIRRRLAEVMEIKTVPYLAFVYDRNIAYADEMSRLISEARASDRDRGESPTIAREPWPSRPRGGD
ncbi:MAG: 30S ribosome-binding factor RbfA [Planctomycetota bacterium]|nr:30S ribosome-binding factor RbfA [Planctomycetota bacterium]